MPRPPSTKRSRRFRFRRSDQFNSATRSNALRSATAIVALERMIPRLAEDHARAARLAAGIHAVDPALVDPRAVETNIVMIDVSRTGRDAQTWLVRLAAHDLQAGPGIPLSSAW
jgi:threonine aldolase